MAGVVVRIHSPVAELKDTVMIRKVETINSLVIYGNGRATFGFCSDEDEEIYGRYVSGIDSNTTWADFVNYVETVLRSRSPSENPTACVIPGKSDEWHEEMFKKLCSRELVVFEGGIITREDMPRRFAEAFIA